VNKVNKQSYAIKVLAKKQIQSEKMRNQIKNEISILELVSHENIIKMETYFEDEANIYLVMELGGVRALFILILVSSLLCVEKRKAI